MVAHWRRQAGTKAGLGNHGRLAINAIGAAASAAVLIVTVITKFAEGAWIILLVVPLFVLLLTRVKRYYVALDRETRDCDRIELEDAAPPVFLVAMENWNRLTCRALGLALRLSPDVAAVHLSSLSGPEAEEMQQRLRREWRADVEEPARRAGRPAPRLIFLETPFRRMREPLLRLIHAIEREFANRPIAVLIPQVVRDRWWQYLLHTRRADRLRRIVLQYDSPRVLVVSVPWHLH